jgi:predicted ArsR family transcriptional regulator
VEERVLGLLAEGALATEQIAVNLRVAEATVRVTLDVLRDSGLVDMSAITQFTGVTGTAAAHWRITDAGRARLEHLRARSQ